MYPDINDTKNMNSGLKIGARAQYMGIVWEFVQEYGCYLWRPISPRELFEEAYDEYVKQASIAYYQAKKKSLAEHPAPEQKKCEVGEEK